MIDFFIFPLNFQGYAHSVGKSSLCILDEKKVTYNSIILILTTLTPFLLISRRIKHLKGNF